MILRTVCLPLAVALSLVTTSTAFAADAGSVVFATGSVTAERQPPATLAKGDAVLDNDTVATGDASRAQLLMLDGAKVAIRPNSQLRIEEYVFQATQPADPSEPVVATSFDRSVSTLLKGGFRTITGAIGKDDETAYEVRTAVGVLGIRGTDYSAVFCNGDCDWVPGVDPSTPIEDGLYLGVTEGTIFFRNEIMEIELDAGEYAFIPLVSRAPLRLDSPPLVLLDDNDLRFEPGAPPPPPFADIDDGSTAGFDSKLGSRREPDGSSSSAEPDTSSSAPDRGSRTPALSIFAFNVDGTPVNITAGFAPQPTGNRNISYSTGPMGLADVTFTGTFENSPPQYRLDGGNNVTGFTGPYPGRTGPINGDYDIGDAANVETGFDSVTVLRWGRWAAGTATVTDPATGQVDPLDLNTQSLHWISGAESGTPPVMPITGTANYSLIGATSPTDNFGNVGVLGAATFNADFTNMRVDSTLVLDIAGITWTAAGIGNIGTAAQLPAHMFSGNYGAVTMGGATGGSGVFSGFFRGFPCRPIDNTTEAASITSPSASVSWKPGRVPLIDLTSAP